LNYYSTHIAVTRCNLQRMVPFSGQTGPGEHNSE
jgi:hypothetical protein